MSPLDKRPSDAYTEGVTSGRWQADPAQKEALASLDRIHDELITARPAGLLDRLFGRGAMPARGLYLWGSVGRGKTFLIDLCYEQLPISGKRRVHFHRFMGEVHARLAELGDVSDPLERIAGEWARDLRLLCLDEFFVTDIGDAMILSRLLQALFKRDVCLLTTSNIEPDGLYRDGLQRARFLPAIELLKKHCEVVHLDSPTDYRLRTLSQAPVYLHPANDDAETGLRGHYQRLTTDYCHEPDTLLINGRAIPVRDHDEGVAWFSFAALCDGPRAVADYIEIARDFHTVLVSNVPVFEASDDDRFRRFVHLVDELYDRHVNLIVSAAVAPTDLYRGVRLQLEFERCSSRLIEMQSRAYLASEHLP
ncbi:MAG TPA: cell division protein ZapE [Xanthomonadaceae bacterium]|nr:cell division protein ZapE [Xanthomonadaceae bacterium]HRX99043.1 cell division protein ZapE [Xanthomonadaceae bacterium]